MTDRTEAPQGGAWVAVLLLLPAMLGCLGGEPPATTSTEPQTTSDPGASTEDTLRVERAEKNGTVYGVSFFASAAGASLGTAYCPSVPEPCEHELGLEIGENVSAIGIEVLSESSTTFTLTVEVPGEYCRSREPAGQSCPGPNPRHSQSPLTLTLEGEELRDAEGQTMTGTWEFEVWTRAQPQPTPVTIRSYVAYNGAELPELGSTS